MGRVMLPLQKELATLAQGVGLGKDVGWWELGPEGGARWFRPSISPTRSPAGSKQNPSPGGLGCQLPAAPRAHQGKRRRRRAGESDTNESSAAAHRSTHTDINHRTTKNPSALSAFLMPLQPSVSPGGRLSSSLLAGFVNSLQTREVKAAEPRARPAVGFDGPSGIAPCSCPQPAIPCLRRGHKRAHKSHAPVIDYLITHAGSHRGGSPPPAALLPLLGHFLLPWAPSLALQHASKGAWSTFCLSFPPDEMKRMLAILLLTVMETRHAHRAPEQQAGLICCYVLAFQPGRSGKKTRREGFISSLVQD